LKLFSDQEFQKTLYAFFSNSRAICAKPKVEEPKYSEIGSGFHENSSFLQSSMRCMNGCFEGNSSSEEWQKEGEFWIQILDLSVIF